MGFDVLLVGRKLKTSPTMDQRSYRTYRMRLFFEKGPLFYMEFQLRLLIFLMFHRAGLLVSNDLDTLAPNVMTAFLKRKPLVYDAHEYFTGVPELKHHPLKRKAWKLLEKTCLPKVKAAFTVNDSIAGLYEKEYGIQMKVVRNLPEKFPFQVADRHQLGLPYDQRILILQGSGINVQRGAEELVEAMQYVEDAILLILGGGDVLPLLKQQVKKLNLTDKVLFKPRMPYHEMMQYTAVSDLGLSLDKGHSVNYLYSLPNKIFDYIHAGIPVLVSDLPEVRKVVEQYGVGDFIPGHDPGAIAEKINDIFAHPERITYWKLNTEKARRELNWEKESEVLKTVYEQYV
jgi:glycosyltransferase involved in cell wall biosynthesis